VALLWDSYLAAGGEKLLNHRPINDDERTQLRDRYHWEVVGPNPL